MDINKALMDPEKAKDQHLLDEDDRQLDKLVSTSDAHSLSNSVNESDNLLKNAVPCGQYRAMDGAESIRLLEQEESAADQQQQQIAQTQRRKHGRKRRMRCISQGSNATIAGGGGGGRRSAAGGAAYSGRIGKRSRRRQLCGVSAPPRHVHCNDWREMLEITKRRDGREEAHEFGAPLTAAKRPLRRSEADLDDVQRMNGIGGGTGAELRALDANTLDAAPPISSSTPSLNRLADHSATASGGGGREHEGRRRYVSGGGSSVQCDWIEQTFCKRDCIQFIASSRDTNKCGCGRYANQHLDMDRHYRRIVSGEREEAAAAAHAKRWSIQRHTALAPTDAYGTIEFQGGPHPFKAQYLRLSFDSDPADIMCLFENVWQMEPPKLIITIHGGITNFDLQPKLARVFRKGLLKAARTTGAWIFTSGINAGVVRQVAAALESAALPTSKLHKIVCVGIAPWGLLKRREDFIGRDKVVLYHPQSFSPKTRFAVLHNRHSFFLLVDNGTVGRYGADIILRRRLESYIAEKQKLGGGNRSVPVVCVVLEGGTCTIRTVLDYVTTIPKVPVVICDGSGRASDLLAFAHQYVQEDGNLPEVIRPKLLSLIEDVFFYDKHNARCLFLDILACVRQKNLITVFRLGENQKQDVDHAILTALLKGHNLSPAEQLSLALAWNRVDIARSDIFVMGQDWPKSALHNAMMEALIHNRVDFVRLLLENGVSMHEFLTIGRLEELYNTDQGPPNTLYYIVRDVVKIRAGYRYKLPHIGMAIEKLMANGFRSHYTSSKFRQQYSDYKNKLKGSQRYNRFLQSQREQQEKTAPNAAGGYHRCGSEFFAARGQPRAMAGSASDTRLSAAFGFGNHQQQQHSTTTMPSSRGAAHPPPPPPPHVSSLFTPMPTIAGNRALSNHILWRTAYRNNPAAQQGTTAAKTPPPHLLHPHHQFFGGAATAATSSTSQFGGVGGPTEEIGYAAEADETLNIMGTGPGGSPGTPDFRYPFSDLLIWAVLTKRHEMALCMWQHGEEAMAKALVACRLYKSLAKEAAEDYLEVEVCEELKKYAEEFRQLSLDLLDHCYKQDDAQTLQLLTYELSYWSQETCLSLAVIVNNKQFLAHPCCQILLADLWHGGLRIRSNSNLKVIFGILFPPSIFLLEFKSREELMLQPQTAAEHQNDINNDTSSSSSGSSSSSSSSDSSDAEAADTEGGATGAEKSAGGGGAGMLADRRRTSHGSMQSLNFTSIFQSKRKRNRSMHLNTTGGNDVESGKARSRDGPSTTQQQSAAKEQQHQQRSSRTKSTAKSGAGGALAKAAQSTLGTATVPIAAGTGGSSPIIQTSPHTSTISAAAHSPLNTTNSSPARMQKITPVITPLHVDTTGQHNHRLSPKPVPQFTLGSIGENAAAENDGGEAADDDSTRFISLTTTPAGKQQLPPSVPEPAMEETAFEEEQYPLSSAATSPQHHVCCAPGAKRAAGNGAGPWGDYGTRCMEEPIDVTRAIDHLHCLTVNGGIVPKGIPLPEGVTLNKKRQIKFRRKLYEFFVAPITTFWSWTLSFVVFLCILTYVLLIRTPARPTFLEWYLLAYVLAFTIEIIRKFIMSEPKKIKEKFEYFFGNYWNFLTAVAIAAFIVGFCFRMHPSTSRTVGRIILAVDSVLWTIKLLDFLGVFPQFGPYITMAGKMIMNMSSIVVMLGISLLGFGLARQSITYPDEDWHWLLLRNVFYKPYFMLYGEVYADEIDICGDDAWDEHLEKNMSIAAAWSQDRDRALACVPGHWIPPILMTVFLLIANILLISMLIAIFNNIFEKTNKISQQIWLFQRYRQVMEYEATPFLPPPFTPVYHVYMVLKYLSYYCRLSRRKASCSCFSPRVCHCFCLCFRRQQQKDKADVQNEEEEAKTKSGRSANGGPALAKNAFEQRRNLQEGRNHTQERLALFDFSLKLFLTEDQVEKLHDFEEECMEDLAREKEYQRNRTSEERLHRTCERTELILLRVNDLSSKETMLKGNVRELETRVEMMENKQTEMLDYLRQLSSMMPSLVQSLQALQQQQQQNSHFNQQTPPNVSHLPTVGSGSGQQMESAGRKTSAPRQQNQMMPARSDGQIFGEKRKSSSQHELGESVGNISQQQQQIFPQHPAQHLLPSVSVDQSLLAASTDGHSSSVTETSTNLLLTPAGAGGQRQQRARSYGNTLEQQPRPPTETPLSEQHHQQRRPTVVGVATPFAKGRSRTSTIAGSDMPSYTCSPLLSVDGDPQHRRLFGGSLISLSPSQAALVEAAASTSAAGAGNGGGASIVQLQARRNTQRWHRQNDEYTSITDTINVEELARGSAHKTSITTGTIEKVEQQLTADGQSIDEKADEEEDGMGEEEVDVQKIRREQMVDEEVQTEDEVDDEEDFEEEEEEEVDGEDEHDDEEEFEEDFGQDGEEDDGEDAASSPGTSIPRRRRKKEIPGKFDGADGTSTEALGFDDSMGTAVGDEFRPRLLTPNSTLQKARSSFVRKHNEQFMSYEEEVGGPSHHPQRQHRPHQRPLRKGKSLEDHGEGGHSAAAAGKVRKRKPATKVKNADEEEQQQQAEEGSLNSSKEFISFKAAQHSPAPSSSTAAADDQQQHSTRC